jgi:hydrogenase-4 component B
VSLFVVALAVFSVGALGSLVCARRARLCSALGALGAGVGCTLGATFAARALFLGSSSSVSFRWSIPNGALSFGVDALSAYFMLPLFVLGGLAAVYGYSYLLGFAATRLLGPPWAAFNMLIASMALVVVSRHAVLFLIAWELMSLMAYVLVTFEHREASVRRAGFVYLIATHIGVAFLIGMFQLLGRQADGFEFERMLAVRSPAAHSSALVFPFALIGFGAKAGFVPLHVWLPEAHAAAPSHVSAVMSGVLIKMGIYGILRVVVLLGGPLDWWGPLLICLGLGSGALGIALATYQRDIKRVLAYSSIENIGLVTLGLGIGFWGARSGHPRIATLGLVGGLLHVWNHAVMKGLLFLGAGSVLHGCHTQDLEQLGGLFRRMPRTALLVILGATAIAGLPPLNGFVSEWLLYSGLLHGALEEQGASGVAVAAAIAIVSLIGAMAALCFVRLVSVALLGEPRSANAERARESPAAMTAPIAVLGLLVVGLALAPGTLTGPMDRVVGQLLGEPATHVPASELGLGKLGALNAGVLGVLGVGLLVALALQRARPTVSDSTWGCGYVAPSTRMQYGARAMSEFFTGGLLPARLAPRFSFRAPSGLFAKAARFESETADPLTRSAYEPLFARWADRFARLRWMQQGMLHVYIVYILVTLLVALAWSAGGLVWAGS